MTSPITTNLSGSQSGGISHSLESRILAFSTAIKRRHLEGSFNVAKETAEIVRLKISKTRFNTLDDLLASIKETGKRLAAIQPLEFAIGNIVRRILYIAREDFRNFSSHDFSSAAPALLSTPSSTTEGEFSEPIENARELKASILTSINELIEELQNIYRNIADQAIEHIHANEVVMTFGGSRTVEEFFKAAGKKRKFEVIVCESAPSFRGQQFAVTLSKAGIETTLIPDSSVFAMMARVNKVIVGTHAVMANGGLIATSGTHMVALAAKHYNVPFVVCTGLYKLSPLYPFDQDTFNDLKSPSAIMQFEEADTLEHVHVQNPAYDYVPPELVSLYVTNFGGHSPSYVYRLLAEYYNPEDTL
eukprot:TRINITY_DN7469_c0_g1_i1.p1 TRINITY_DN7469_c0_g1~~TRINITY_DN7469_c0_g1_i1.p1  ORF type:complete len:361 (-),score=62.78 TRINITY_DN7469_c0_g1_i1:18-1100(-)